MSLYPNLLKALTSSSFSAFDMSRLCSRACFWMASNSTMLGLWPIAASPEACTGPRIRQCDSARGHSAHSKKPLCLHTCCLRPRWRYQLAVHLSKKHQCTVMESALLSTKTFCNIFVHKMHHCRLLIKAWPADVACELRSARRVLELPSPPGPLDQLWAACP